MLSKKVYDDLARLIGNEIRYGGTLESFTASLCDYLKSVRVEIFISDGDI